MGYDLHPIVADRPLILGGVRIRDELGLGGNTDGDVVLHALIDALFGAAGLPDLGEHFPESNQAIRSRGSSWLLEQALQEIRPLGWRIGNVDLTIVAERPKLSQHKVDIRTSIAALLDTEVQRVSVKAKTNEGFDAVGLERAIACQATVLLSRGTG